LAEKKFLTHLKSIGNSELRGWAFERLATDPATPTDGQVWENTADEAIKFYNGTSVVTLLDTGGLPIASETVAGIIELATQAEANTGTDDLKAITPLKLKTILDALVIPKVFGIALNDALTEVTRVFGGGQTVYTVVHAQNVTNYVPSVKEISTGEEVIADVIKIDANTIEVSFNGNSTDNTFNLSFVGA